MTYERFTVHNLQDHLDDLKTQYDAIRLVNPDECRTFHFDDGGSPDFGTYCYSTWDITNRCKNCVSLEALQINKEMDKVEYKDNNEYQIHAKPIEVYSDDGTVYYCVIEMITIRPVPFRKEKEVNEEGFSAEHTYEYAQTLSYIFDYMPAGILCFDNEGNCIYANGEAFRIFRLREGLAKLEEVFRNWIGQNMEASWTQPLTNADGTHQFRIQKNTIRDYSDQETGFYYVLTDITDRQKQLDVEHYRATHDELTKLYNRYGFYQAARDLLLRDPQRRYAMVTSDIRDFKLINDLFGLNVGNEVIVALAKKIQEKLGGRDNIIFGRLHADRFAVCLPMESLNLEGVLAEMNAISQRYSNSSFALVNHVGAFEIKDIHMPITQMCDRASLAIKTIHDQAANMVVWYNDDMLKETLRGHSIINEFQAALQSNQFRIFLQPLITREGELIGAEALSRWIHPEKGIISPADYIPILEEHGQIHLLDRKMWELAAMQLHEWKNTPLEKLYLSVNISTRDLYYVDLFDEFVSLCDRYQIAPSQLKLEITESVFMQNTEQNLSLIDRLQNYGFYVAIDDFGSGYSSLNMLKDIKADILKIDMNFLHETENKARSKTILNSIISLSHSLGMRVVTEGVETKAQVDFLSEVGCDIFQGFYFSKPIPAAEFVNQYFPPSEKQEAS